MCVAVIYTDVRGGTVLRDKQVKRAARRLWQVPLNMGECGNEPMRGGGSDGKEKEKDEIAAAAREKGTGKGVVWGKWERDSFV